MESCKSSELTQAKVSVGHVEYGAVFELQKEIGAFGYLPKC